VFADLGFPDAAERQAKLRLAFALNQVLEERKLSQADAAKVLGVTEPKVSALRHYKLVSFFRRTSDEPVDGASSLW
jgi:predicted XRE-type DNA-binding protein